MKRQGKKKILFVITQGAWGGAQRYVFDLATRLTKTHDISVAIGEIEGKKDLQTKLEIGNWKLDILELKHLKRNISPLHDVLAIFELRKLYKKIQPDIIHLNSSKAGIVGSLAKFIMHNSSLKIVYTVHGWVFNEPLPKFKKTLYKFLEKGTARMKDAFITLSPQDEKTARDIVGIKNEKLFTIPLGIEMPKQERTRQEAKKQMDILSKQSNDTFIFGAIAGLYKTKGLDTLIQAIGKQKGKLANCQFIIIGEGPERAPLEKLISQLELEDTVHLLGYVEDASTLLPAFDAFVLPSRKEGLPYTILEAQATGIPIIATKVGGVPSMIDDNKTGILVEPENVGELGEALIDMKNNIEYWKKQISEKQTNKIYTVENMVKKTKALYFSRD